MTAIFVYGTLKTGGSNHSFMVGQALIGQSRTAPGYTLYELFGYPGLIPMVGDSEGVAGELWSVDDAALCRLDALEGTDEGLYRRAPIELVGEFSGLRVDTYFYLRSVEGRRRIGAEWTGCQHI